MTDPLYTLLPLNQYQREIISAGTDLHHFGLLDVSKHILNRPFWVSDKYFSALKYKKFSIPRPYYIKLVNYTKLATSQDFKVVNFNNISLQSICVQLNIYDHVEWNKYLAKYLLANNVPGIVYADREIFLANPSPLIKTAISQQCTL